MLGRVAQLRRQLADVQWRTGALERAGQPRSGAPAEAAASGRAFAEQAARIFSAEMLDGDPQTFFEQASKAIAAASAHGAEVQDSLAAALLGGALSLGGVLLLAYFATAFHDSCLGAVPGLGRGMPAVADGDLSHEFDILRRDEMARIGQVVERMSERFGTMVAEIRSSAVRVSDTGQMLAGGSATLAERTETQASSLWQFVGTVGQPGTAVAGNAAEVSELARGGRDPGATRAAPGSPLQAVVDRQSRYVLHGAKPATEGRRVHDGLVIGCGIHREAAAAASQLSAGAPASAPRAPAGRKESQPPARHRTAAAVPAAG